MVRQTFTGLVISQGKMNKTIKVRVRKIRFNRVIHKDIVEYKDFMVHDELNKCQEGDVVRIQYVRPLSTKKSFAVAEIMKYKGTEWMKYQSEAPERVAKEELEKLQQYNTERIKRLELEGRDEKVEQLKSVEKAFLEPTGNNNLQNDEKIQQLMSKYGISSWPPSHQVLELNTTKLRQQLKELNIEIDNKTFSPIAKQMIENEPEKADRILREAGVENPQELKANIKKNMLTKQLVKQYNNL